LSPDDMDDFEDEDIENPDDDFEDSGFIPEEEETEDGDDQEMPLPSKDGSMPASYNALPPPQTGYQQPYYPPQQGYQPGYPPQQPMMSKEALEAARKKEMEEAGVEESSKKKGVKAAILAALKYTALPIIIITIITLLLKMMGGDEGGDIDLGMSRIAAAAIIWGIVLIIISFFKGYYPRGTKGRLIAAELRVLFSILWILTIFGGPILDLTLSMDQDNIGIQLDTSKIIGIAILLLSLMFAYYALEYHLYAKDRKAFFDKEKGAESGQLPPQSQPPQQPAQQPSANAVPTQQSTPNTAPQQPPEPMKEQEDDLQYF